MDNLTAKPATLIVGCGYLGLRVLRQLTQQNGATADQPTQGSSSVFATTRSCEKAMKIAKLGAQPLLIDWTDRRSLAGLPPVQRVLVAVSYDPRGRHSRYDSQVGGLLNLLDVLPADCQIVYISTTGVYHQTGGLWVDEASPTRPRSEGGEAHLRAESLLHKYRPKAPTVILRLAGIYGPGRVPRVADVIARRPLDGANQGYLNLIQVDDAARAVIAAWTNLNAEKLYVVADDRPVLRTEFYKQIARLAGVGEPDFQFNDSHVAIAAASRRAGTSKRVWNRRFRRDLISRLTFPTYIEGLAALDWHAARNVAAGRGRA